MHRASPFAVSCPGELNSRLNSDTKLMSSWLPLNANVGLRSLVKVVGLYSFMFKLSPRLTLLSLLDVPLTIAAEKVYNVRHQVCVAARELPRESVLEVFFSRPFRAAVLTGFRRSTTPGAVCKCVCLGEGRREGRHVFLGRGNGHKILKGVCTYLPHKRLKAPSWRVLGRVFPS